MTIIGIKSEITIEIRNSKTKEIISIKKFKNSIVNNGLKMFRNWAAGIAPLNDPDYNVDCRITDFAVGDDNTAVSLTQTSLGNELLRKELYPTPDPNCEINIIDNSTVEYVIFIGETELNGSIIKEMGLFSTNQTTPFMISRFLTGNLSKTSVIEFTIKYKYKFQNV